jgi:hypothetical protein
MDRSCLASVVLFCLPACAARAASGPGDSISPSGSWSDGEALSSDAGATGPTGVVLALGVAPGPVGVSARFDGQPLGAALGFAYSAAVTSLVVRP